MKFLGTMELTKPKKKFLIIIWGIFQLLLVITFFLAAFGGYDFTHKGHNYNFFSVTKIGKSSFSFGPKKLSSEKILDSLKIKIEKFKKFNKHNNFNLTSDLFKDQYGLYKINYQYSYNKLSNTQFRFLCYVFCLCIFSIYFIKYNLNIQKGVIRLFVFSVPMFFLIDISGFLLGFIEISLF